MGRGRKKLDDGLKREKLVSVRVEPELYEKFHYYTTKEEVTTAALIYEYIESYVKRWELIEEEAHEEKIELLQKLPEVPLEKLMDKFINYCLLEKRVPEDVLVPFMERYVARWDRVTKNSLQSKLSAIEKLTGEDKETILNKFFEVFDQILEEKV